MSVGRILFGAAVCAGTCGYLACSLTSLDDLRGDGAAGDVAVDTPLEVSSDGPGDASSDADGGALFRCTESIGSRIQIDQNVRADFVRTAPVLGGMGRIVATDYVPVDGGFGYQLVVRGYLFMNNGTQVTPVPLTTTNYSTALAVRRYSAAGHSGFVALYASLTGALSASLLPDEQSTWTTPLLLANVGNDAGQTDVQGDIDVVDPTTNDFFVAYTALTGTVQTIFAGEVKNATTALSKLAAFNNTVARPVYALSTPALAYRNQVGYVMLSAQGNNGPPSAGAPDLLLTTTGSQVTITPASSLNYFGLGFADSTDPTLVNALFLVANLGTLTGSFAVGQLTTSALATLNPQSLPITQPTAADGGAPTLDEFFFENPSVHWDNLGSGDQATYTGPEYDPITQSTGGGIDFAWWDAPSGGVRAYAAGRAGALFADIYPSCSDAMLSSVTGSIAAVDFAWAQVAADAGTNFHPPPPSSLWIATAGCLK